MNIAKRETPNLSMERDLAEPGDPLRYQQEAAQYMVSMLAELRQIADKAGMNKIVHALDAAYYEAYSAAQSSAPANKEKSQPSLDSD